MDRSVPSLYNELESELKYSVHRRFFTKPEKFESLSTVIDCVLHKANEADEMETDALGGQRNNMRSLLLDDNEAYQSLQRQNVVVNRALDEVVQFQQGGLNNTVDAMGQVIHGYSQRQAEVRALRDSLQEVREVLSPRRGSARVPLKELWFRQVKLKATLRMLDDLDFLREAVGQVSRLCSQKRYMNAVHILNKGLAAIFAEDLCLVQALVPVRNALLRHKEHIIEDILGTLRRVAVHRVMPDAAYAQLDDQPSTLWPHFDQPSASARSSNSSRAGAGTGAGSAELGQPATPLRGDWWSLNLFEVTLELEKSLPDAREVDPLFIRRVIRAATALIGEDDTARMLVEETHGLLRSLADSIRSHFLSALAGFRVAQPRKRTEDGSGSGGTSDSSLAADARIFREYLRTLFSTFYSLLRKFLYMFRLLQLSREARHAQAADPRLAIGTHASTVARHVGSSGGDGSSGSSSGSSARQIDEYGSAAARKLWDEIADILISELSLHFRDPDPSDGGVGPTRTIEVLSISDHEPSAALDALLKKAASEATKGVPCGSSSSSSIGSSNKERGSGHNPTSNSSSSTKSSSSSSSGISGGNHSLGSPSSPSSPGSSGITTSTVCLPGSYLAASSYRLIVHFSRKVQHLLGPGTAMRAPLRLSSAAAAGGHGRAQREHALKQQQDGGQAVGPCARILQVTEDTIEKSLVPVIQSEVNTRSQRLFAEETLFWATSQSQQSGEREGALSNSHVAAPAVQQSTAMVLSLLRLWVLLPLHRALLAHVLGRAIRDFASAAKEALHNLTWQFFSCEPTYKVPVLESLRRDPLYLVGLCRQGLGAQQSQNLQPTRTTQEPRPNFSLNNPSRAGRHHSHGSESNSNSNSNTNSNSNSNSADGRNREQPRRPSVSRIEEQRQQALDASLEMNCWAQLWDVADSNYPVNASHAVLDAESLAAISSIAHGCETVTASLRVATARALSAADSDSAWGGEADSDGDGVDLFSVSGSESATASAAARRRRSSADPGHDLASLSLVSSSSSSSPAGGSHLAATSAAASTAAAADGQAVDNTGISELVTLSQALQGHLEECSNDSLARMRGELQVATFFLLRGLALCVFSGVGDGGEEGSNMGSRLHSISAAATAYEMHRKHGSSSNSSSSSSSYGNVDSFRGDIGGRESSSDDDRDEHKSSSHNSHQKGNNHNGNQCAHSTNHPSNRRNSRNGNGDLTKGSVAAGGDFRRDPETLITIFLENLGRHQAAVIAAAPPALYAVILSPICALAPRVILKALQYLCAEEAPGEGLVSRGRTRLLRALALAQQGLRVLLENAGFESATLRRLQDTLLDEFSRPRRFLQLLGAPASEVEVCRAEFTVPEYNALARQSAGG